MSTIDELYAPKFLGDAGLTDEVQKKMAESLECDSLRYLPVESIARAIDLPRDHLCQACITGEYPTPNGQRLYSLAQANYRSGQQAKRTYEA
jgi:amidophosphoribosyltransferase